MPNRTRGNALAPLGVAGAVVAFALAAPHFGLGTIATAVGAGVVAGLVALALRGKS